MKEIKFREGIFLKGVFLRWHYWGYVGYRNEFEGPITISGIRNEYEVKESQQYTCRRDKADKRIYEGDIVQSPSGEICIVKWNQELCQCIAHVADDQLRILVDNYYTIIGNIHETPELKAASK